MSDPMVFSLVPQITGAVAGGIVGGFAGFVANIFHGRAVSRAKLRNIASALIGEIGALTQLIRDEYMGHLSNIGSLDDASSNDHPIRGEQNYMPIFRSLGSEIGGLPAPLPHELIMWYTALTVGLERAHALHNLALRNDLNDAANLNKLVQDQIRDLENLSHRSEMLIVRLADL